MMKYLSRTGGAVPAPARPDPAFEAELAAAFRDDIDRLERLLETDLSDWRV